MQIITSRFAAIRWLLGLMESDGGPGVVPARFESPCLAIEVVEAPLRAEARPAGRTAARSYPRY